MKTISTLAVAFTYVGTIVGAGFASGQEIKKYFTDYGVYGIASYCIAAVLIFLLGKKIMLMCRKNNINSYDKLISLLSGNIFGKLFDFFITIFLIGTLTTMSAGMGTILNQVFSIPIWFGNLVLMLFSIIIVKKGINEISKINIFIVPILILVTIIISGTSCDGFEVSLVKSASAVKSLFSMILYVAYNIIMSISILPALALSANEKSIKRGTMLAGIIIAFLGLLMSFALLTNYDIIQNVEIPLAVIADKYVGFYIVTFILEVFSTAVSSLYGVYTRVNKKNKMLYIISLCAYCFSLFGFSNLVTYLYGIMGVIGIFMIGILIKGDYR
ncbi:MAG: hypothetical protein E7314_02570 [Clostridiales bacterium]|nr:hypothetical protein [Clostridiales bacterium]